MRLLRRVRAAALRVPRAETASAAILRMATAARRPGRVRPAALIVVATSTSRRHTAPSRRTAASSEGRGSAAPPSSRPASNIRESASSCPATGWTDCGSTRRRALGHPKHLAAHPRQHRRQELVRDAFTVPVDERRRRPAVPAPGVHPRRAPLGVSATVLPAARLGGQQVDPLPGGARQPRHQRAPARGTASGPRAAACPRAASRAEVRRRQAD